MKPSERWMSLVTYYAERVNWPADLAYRQMLAESSGNPKAVSPCGALGLFQLMPATAQELGVNPRDPEENIKGGLEYDARQLANVRLLLHAYPLPMDELYRLALCGYCAGGGYVRASLKKIIRAGSAPSWESFKPVFHRIEINGKRPDTKARNPKIADAIEYAEEIVPLPPPQV